MDLTWPDKGKLPAGQVIRTKLDQPQTQETSFARLREVPAMPLRAGRHLTAWIVWHTARRSTLSDLTVPQPPEESHGRAASTGTA
jgi:hypothetical protein